MTRSRRASVLLARGGPIAALVALSAWLLAGSSLWLLLPSPPPVWALLVGLLLLYAPALLTRRSPLPAALAVLVPVIAAASYDQSRLDWLRLLKDFGVTDTTGAGPSVVRVALSLLALLLVWALHVADHATRLRLRALERGLDAREARAASRLALRVGARRAALALGATLLLCAIVAAASFAQADRLLAGRAALVAPLVAAVLVAGAAVLLARQGRGKSSDERE